MIFRLLSESSASVRQSTAYALSRIVSKGLKEPSDKLQLLRVLSLAEVLEALEEKSRAARPAGSGAENHDEAEESFREGLGKLACSFGNELVDLIGDVSLKTNFMSVSLTFFAGQLAKRRPYDR